MKKMFYLAALVGGIFFAQPSNAQVSISVNIGTQPQWGPVGYDYVRYYYLPEIDMYYDVAARRYVYYDRGWVRRSHVPPRYRNFDFYRTYKVVVNDASPWNRHQYYRKQYRRYATVHGRQTSLRHNQQRYAFANDRGRVASTAPHRYDSRQAQRNDRNRNFSQGKSRMEQGRRHEQRDERGRYGRN